MSNVVPLHPQRSTQRIAKRIAARDLISDDRLAFGPQSSPPLTERAASPESLARLYAE